MLDWELLVLQCKNTRTQHLDCSPVCISHQKANLFFIAPGMGVLITSESVWWCRRRGKKDSRSLHSMTVTFLGASSMLRSRECVGFSGSAGDPHLLRHRNSTADPWADMRGYHTAAQYVKVPSQSKGAPLSNCLILWSNAREIFPFIHFTSDTNTFLPLRIPELKSLLKKKVKLS